MNLPNKPRVLAATYNPISNTKMISFLVDFPTVLLAELRTHRIITQGSLYEHSELTDISMSANSARAIPSKTYLQKILENPFTPIWTGKQAGMSGSNITEQQKEQATHLWLEHLQSDIVDTGTAQYVEDLIELGIHKQNCSRLLSPYAYTTCILSGTEWDNLFFLRLGKDAQPEFKEIAILLKKLYDSADWKESKYHIPFEDEIKHQYWGKIENSFLNVPEPLIKGATKELDVLMKVSASMCAKLSYNTQDNEDALEKHLDRANMLIESKHQEPFSHQAVAMSEDEYEMFTVTKLVNHKYVNGNFNHINSLGGLQQIVEKGKCYNLTGFISQRYILENY
jgi:hypothetical protein